MNPTLYGMYNDRYKTTRPPRILLTILCLVFASVISHAALRKDINVMYLGPRQGLSHPTVNSIYQDEFGFVWIGTIDGLNRFDGNRIDIFKPDRHNPHSIFTNVIMEIYGDRAGHLFIRGQHSAMVYDMRTSRFKTLMPEGVNAITYKDRLWIATSNEVYSYLPPFDTPELYFSLGQSKLSSSASIQYICVDNDGVLYLATNNTGLIRVDTQGNIERYPINNISSIFCDNKNTIWVLTMTNGFYRLDAQSGLKSYLFDSREPNAQDKNNTRCMVQRSDNIYYIGTYDGLMLFDSQSGEFTPYIYEYDMEAFSSRAVRVMHHHDGTLFIGTYHAGAQYYNEKDDFYRIYSPLKKGENYLTAPIASSVAMDVGGTLWVGTISGGLNIFDPNGNIPREFRNRIMREPALTNIKSLHYDKRENALWAGTFSEGIIRIDIGRRNIRHIPPAIHAQGIITGAAQNIIEMIPVGAGDSLIIASFNGLLAYDRISGRIDNINHILTPKPNTYIIAIELDADQMLWVATMSCIYRVDPRARQTRRIYTLDNIGELSADNMITDIFCDRGGELWFGSSGSGLFKYDESRDRFVNYGPGEGLTNTHINHIAQGRSSDKLFLATNEGVVSFDPSAETFENHNGRNGYPLSIIDRIFTTPDSVVYACGQNGVVAIKENRFVQHKTAYEVFIKDIYVNNKLVVPLDSTEILRASALYQHEITLRPNHSVIAFEIAGSISDIAFEYMLEGFDKNFSASFDNNMITYTNLNPGQYRLLVRGTAADTEMPTASMNIRVLAPFYRTWWFVLLVTLSIVGLSMTILYHYLHGQRLKISLEKERLDKEHIEKVNRSKMDLFTKVSHEFRTPLTLINSYLDIMLQNSHLPKPERDSVLGAYKNVRQLNDLVDEFIDIRKHENEELVIRPETGDIVSCVHGAYTMFTDYARNRRVKMEFTSETDRCEISFDRTLILKVMNNLLSNAFKYVAGQEGRIGIAVSKQESSVKISVSDNGIGILPENMERIFEYFWQEERANTASEIKGSGIGLSYVKNIVEMHGGTITVSSIPSQGSVFTVELPCESAPCEKGELHTDKRETVPEPPGEEATEPGNPTVLVVEDNDEMRRVLEHVLAPHYHVQTADNGETGLEKARRLQPDLVVSDVMMPAVSGVELCGQLKSDFSTSHIPVILLTALTADTQVIEGLSCGADDYITKPFNINVLLARCDNIINSRKRLQEKYRRETGQPEESLTQNPRESKLLASAVKIVEEHIDDPDFDILIFARELGVSRTNLFNKIKGLTGLTPNNFVLSVRLKVAAARILEYPDVNTSQIAYECGFNTSSHFAKCFKQTFGTTPLKYRNRQTGKQ